jgi:hypothetical protein
MTKKAKSMSASKQKVSGGPSGKMQKFVPVKGQKPGGSAVTNSGRGKK